MAFDPLKEGAIAVFDPVSEGGIRRPGAEVVPVAGKFGQIESNQELLEQFITSDNRVLDLVPQEQAAFAGSILNSLENPEDDEAKMTNSLYLADLFNITPEEALLLHDGLAEAMLNKDTVPAIEFLKEIKKFEIRRKTAIETLIDGYHTMGINMVKGVVAGPVRAIGELGLTPEAIKASKEVFDAFGIEPNLNLNKKLAEWGALMNEAADVYLQEHPEEASQIIPGKGFFGTAKQYLQRPEAILQGAVEATPMLLEAYLGHITGTAAAKYVGWGQKLFPWMGRVQGIAAPITGQTYADTRAAGTPIELALPQALLTGQIEGIIEEWTLSQKIKVFKGVGAAARKGIAKSAAAILIGGSKSFARGTAEEAAQQFSGNFWNMIFADPDQKLFEGVGEAAAAGGFVELFMTGGFASAGKLTTPFKSELSIDQKTQRTEQVRDMMDKADLSSAESAEVNTEIDRVIENVKNGVEPTARVEPGEAAEGVAPVTPEKPTVTPEEAETEAQRRAEAVSPEVTQVEEIQPEGGTVEQFSALGQQQRGRPESVMLEATSHHSGIWSFLIEHVGDLTHRMTERVNQKEDPAGFGASKSKIERAFNFLTEGQFGRSIEETHEQNIINNAELSKQTEQEFRNTLNQLGEAYSNEHAKLPVFNEVQKRARDAAIALGKQDFATATEHVTWLKNLIDQGEEAWNAKALEGLAAAEVTAEAGLIPGTEIEFDRVESHGSSTVTFFKDGKGVHTIKARNITEATKQAENFRTLLKGIEPTAEAGLVEPLTTEEVEAEADAVTIPSLIGDIEVPLSRAEKVTKKKMDKFSEELEEIFIKGSHLQMAFSRNLDFHYFNGTLEDFVGDYIIASSRGIQKEFKLKDEFGNAIIKEGPGDLPIVFDSADSPDAKRFKKEFIETVEKKAKDIGLMRQEGKEVLDKINATHQGISVAFGKAGPQRVPTQQEITETIRDLLTEAEGIEAVAEAGLVEPLTTEEVEAKKTKRIISEDAYKAAKRRITDPSKLRTGLDPSDVKDMAIIGAFHFETGVRKFAEWSAKMLSDLGEFITPHLRDIYRRIVQTEVRADREVETEVLEEFSDEKWAARAITRAEKGIKLKKAKPTVPPVVTAAALRIESLQEEVTELEKLRAENKALEGTTQFDPGFEKFTEKQIAKKTKEIEQIREVKPPAARKKEVGLTRAEIELLTPAQQKELRARQARGEKVGFRAGEEAARGRAKTEVLKLLQAQELTEGRRNTARELVIKFVPRELRGDFLTRITKAKTPRDLRRISAAIQQGITREEKRDAIDDLREAARMLKPKKMLPEFAETAQKILDSIQIGILRPDTVVRNSDLREMARQVLDTARPDSVAGFQAQQVLNELQEKMARTFAINQLSVEAINQITDTLIALRFQNELDTIAAKDENATEAIRRRDEIQKEIVETPDVPESLGGKQIKKFKLFHDNLESVLDATSGARSGTYDLWKKSKKSITEFVYDVLDKGIDNQILHNEKARAIFRQILTDNNVAPKDILNWSMRPEDISIVKKVFGFELKPQVHKFTMKNARGKATEFEFTTNELMSIFMHFRNNHNLSVLLKDGLNRTIKGRKQKIRGFTVDTIEKMADSLTDQQKKVARQTGSKLMDGLNKDAINVTSVILEFFELAKVINYWPARRSITRIVRGRKLAGTVRTVEGMGLLKERVGIGNPMKLAGFFESVYATNKNVATYVGLAEPLREVKAVYNKDTIEELENKGRGDEAKLITDLLERFEGQSPLIGPLDTLIKRMLGGFAKAVLFLNAKLAPRQQISSFLISAYVDTKYITAFRGIATKEVTDEMNKLSPQTKARIEGLQFDRDIGDAFIENELMNYLTGKTTIIDKTAFAMRYFDKNAIVDLYRAAKAEVTDNNPGININSKEGKALLKDRFEWLVRHTQPMWSPKDRSLIGSDPRPLIRSLTMFMSQREQLVRMFNNGVADYVNSDKTTQDATRLGKVLGTVAMNLAAFTLYNFAWAVLIRKKKRDVKDLGKNFIKDILSLPFFGKYIAKSFELVFNVLVDKPVFQEDFGDGPIETILRQILIDAIPGFTRAGKHFVTKERYQSGPNRGEEKWKNELLVAIDALVEAITSLKGIPYRGAKNIVKITKAQLTKSETKREPLF